MRSWVYREGIERKRDNKKENKGKKVRIKEATCEGKR